MWLILRHKRSKIQSRNFERVFAKCIYRTEVLHMSDEEYKNQIIKIVKQLNDVSILRRIYLILVAIVGEVK